MQENYWRKTTLGRKDLLCIWINREHLIKWCKKNTSLFVTNQEWPEIAQEELKYYLEEYGKWNSLKTQRKELGSSEIQDNRTNKDSIKYVSGKDSRKVEKQLERWTN